MSQNDSKPNLKDLFLETKQAKTDLVVERAAPKAWRAGTVTEDGQTTVTTKPIPAEQGTPEERELLAQHGFNPDRYRIVGPIRSSTWTAYIPKEYRTDSEHNVGGPDAPGPGESMGGGSGDGRFTFTARAFKFTVEERPHDEPSVDELIQAIERPEQPNIIIDGPVRSLLDPAKPYVVAVGDTQIGKEIDSPTDELLERAKGLLAEAAAPAKAAAEAGEPLQHIHLPWLGDCIEGMNSQGGKNRWRTRLTLTEQVRVLRRLMLWQIQLFAPLTERLTVISVPGNHDEANTRDLATRVDDSWAIETLVAINDALELATEYQHVETYVPGPDQRTVVLDIGETYVAHSHGHEHAHGKHFQYWAGQAFGGQDMGQATLWLQGHGHHLHIQEDGRRKWIQVPAVERESVWWKHKTGTGGSPGVVSFQLWDNEISNLTKHEPEPLAA